MSVCPVSRPSCALLLYSPSLIICIQTNVCTFAEILRGADLYLTPSSKLVDTRKDVDVERDKDLARGNWQNRNNPNVFLISVNLFTLWISHLFDESLASELGWIDKGDRERKAEGGNVEGHCILWIRTAQT